MFTFAQDGKACMRIVCSADAPEPEQYAATELRHYLELMTAVLFEIAPDAGDGHAIYLGHAAEAAGASCDTPLGDDGFRLLSQQGSVYILGGKRGVIYGVYELLERLGCRFFTSSCERIPVDAAPVVPELDEVQVPVVEYREHNYADLTQNARFAVKRRFNGNAHRIQPRHGRHHSYAWFVHTFERMVSPEEFAASHPEYFSLVDGKRCFASGGRHQLCLTNPDVLSLCTQRVRAALQEHLEATLISISQNDWGGNCQCESCRQVDAAEGSPAGTLLRFVNAIAQALEDEFPHVVFDTLAYNYSRPAPRITRNRHNVCVRLCSIECCFAHPFESCDDDSRSVHRPDGTTSSFITDLREWGRICDRMYIWDYTTCFAHYPTPHPNWRVLQPNVQAMVRNNVRGIFEQACGAQRGGVDFNELRAYLISRLLWDPDTDVETHRREFMEHYYGAAAGPLMEYQDLICDTCERDNIHVGFNDNPTHGFLTEEMLDRYEGIFDAAAAAVASDPLRLWRVGKARLSIRWVRLKRAAMLQGERDADAIQAFFADWRAYGLSRIDEWCSAETTHRALLDGLWRGVSYYDHWAGEGPEVF